MSLELCCLRSRKTIRNRDDSGISLRPDSAAMSICFTKRKYGSSEGRGSADLSILSGLMPSSNMNSLLFFMAFRQLFHVFFSSLQNHAPGSLCEPSNAPHLFQRTTRIVLVNDAFFGNDTGVSGARPVVFPNQTISISEGAGFRPPDIIMLQQRLNFSKAREKSMLPTSLSVRTYSTMIPQTRSCLLGTLE